MTVEELIEELQRLSQAAKWANVRVATGYSREHGEITMKITSVAYENGVTIIR